MNADYLVKGAVASPGVGTGPVVVIHSVAELDLVKPGDVLVSPMTTPDFLPAMKRAVAIVTEKGGRTCHAAIVSRELGVPCIVGAPGATTVLQTGDIVTVDAHNGLVFAGVREIAVGADPGLPVRSSEGAKAGISPTEKTITKTKIYVNLADPDQAERVAKLDVDGVGLLRAEFMAAHIGEHPRAMIADGRGSEYTEKLMVGIRKFAQAFYPRPVVYRTTDFKTNEYRNLKGGTPYEPEEENPMIGWRGCFRYLEDREVFDLEVSAIAQVEKEFDNLRVMIPFVRTPEELAGVKKILDDRGVAQGKLWMMVEVPSAVILLDKFLDLGISGVSIGTNDLTQLVLGVDRDSERCAELFDERNPAVLWCLERIITTCKQRGVSVSICGQAPSFYPDLTAKLVSWGITSVSVTPDMIDQTRKIVNEVEKTFK